MLQKICSFAGLSYQTCGNLPAMFYVGTAFLAVGLGLRVPEFLLQKRWNDVAERLGIGKSKTVKEKFVWIPKKLKTKRQKPFFGKIVSAQVFDDTTISIEKWNSPETIQMLEGVLKVRIAVIKRPKIGGRYVQIIVDTLS